MIDLEAVPGAHRPEHRTHDLFRHIFHPLAARADEMVVMDRGAGRIDVDVARALEPGGLSVGDLGLEGAVHGRQSDPLPARADAGVELLRAQRDLPLGEALRDDEPLPREAPRDTAPLRDLRGLWAHRRLHGHEDSLGRASRQ